MTGKTLLLVICLYSYSAGVFGQVLTDQNTVDQYVSLAMANTAEKLQGEGRHHCEYLVQANAYGTDPKYEAHGKTVEEAQQRLALVCIKERCQQVGRWIVGSLGYMDQLSDSDNEEFMRAQGYDEEKIRDFRAARSRADLGALNSLTCAESVPLGRMVVFDSCFAMPMQCR